MSLSSDVPLSETISSVSMSVSFSTPPSMPASPAQFYRKPLPAHNIALCSNEGKALFREALLSGYMDCYFGLASQFITQAEPAFCGLSTLVMVLNTLEVDPQKVWKAPWRWYHENMLDCCVPLEIVEKSGITLDQFACLALCNTLDIMPCRVDQSTNIDAFRQCVRECTSRSDKILVVTYSREVLGQTGTGHFSPIGGYHSARDLVLILDVARFKYPPHWVPLTMLYEAMQRLDPDTGLARGYIVLSKRCTVPTILFRFSSFVSITGSRTSSERVVECESLWNEFLSKKCHEIYPGGWGVKSTGVTKSVVGGHHGDEGGQLDDESAEQKIDDDCKRALFIDDSAVVGCYGYTPDDSAVVGCYGYTPDEEFLEACVQRLAEILDVVGTDLTLLEEQLDVTRPAADVSNLHCCSALGAVTALEQTPIGNVVRRWLNRNVANDTIEIPENYSAICSVQSVPTNISLSRVEEEEDMEGGVFEGDGNSVGMVAGEERRMMSDSYGSSGVGKVSVEELSCSITTQSSGHNLVAVEDTNNVTTGRLMSPSGAGHVTSAISHHVESGSDDKLMTSEVARACSVSPESSADHTMADVAAKSDSYEKCTGVNQKLNFEATEKSPESTLTQVGVGSVAVSGSRGGGSVAKSCAGGKRKSDVEESGGCVGMKQVKEDDDELKPCDTSVDNATLARWHYLTALLLLWPYSSSSKTDSGNNSVKTNSCSDSSKSVSDINSVNISSVYSSGNSSVNISSGYSSDYSSINTSSCNNSDKIDSTISSSSSNSFGLINGSKHSGNLWFKGNTDTSNSSSNVGGNDSSVDLKSGGSMNANSSNNNSNRWGIIDSSCSTGDSSCITGDSSCTLAEHKVERMGCHTETVGSRLSRLMEQQLNDCNNMLLQNEILLLRQQLSSVLTYVKKCYGNKDKCTCRKAVTSD